MLYSDPLEILSEEFVHNDHRYADALFQSYLEAQADASSAAGLFQFELYASGEYSRKVESERENNP